MDISRNVCGSYMGKVCIMYTCYGCPLDGLCVSCGICDFVSCCCMDNLWITLGPPIACKIHCMVWGSTIGLEMDKIKYFGALVGLDAIPGIWGGGFDGGAGGLLLFFVFATKQIQKNKCENTLPCNQGELAHPEGRQAPWGGHQTPRHDPLRGVAGPRGSHMNTMRRQADSQR